MDPSEYNRLLLLRECQIREEELRMAALQSTAVGATAAAAATGGHWMLPTTTGTTTLLLHDPLTGAIAPLSAAGTAMQSSQATYQQQLHALLLQEAQVAALAKQQHKEEDDTAAAWKAAEKQAEKKRKKEERKRQAKIAAEEAERLVARLDHDARISADMNQQLLRGELRLVADAADAARPDDATSHHQHVSKPSSQAQQQTQNVAVTFETFVDSHGRTITPLTNDELQSIQRGILQVPPTMTLAQTPEGVPILVSSIVTAPPTDLNTTNTEQLPYYDTLLLEQRLTRNKVENVENLLTQQQKTKERKQPPPQQEQQQQQRLDASHSSSSEDGNHFPNMKDRRFKTDKKNPSGEEQRSRYHEHQQLSQDAPSRSSSSHQPEYHRDRSNNRVDYYRDRTHRSSSPRYEEHPYGREYGDYYGTNRYYQQQQQQHQQYYQQHGQYPQHYDQYQEQQYQQYYQQHGRYPEQYYQQQQQQQYYRDQQQPRGSGSYSHAQYRDAYGPHRHSAAESSERPQGDEELMDARQRHSSSVRNRRDWEHRTHRSEVGHWNYRFGRDTTVDLTSDKHYATEQRARGSHDSSHRRREGHGDRHGVEQQQSREEPHKISVDPHHHPEGHKKRKASSDIHSQESPASSTHSSSSANDEGAAKEMERRQRMASASTSEAAAAAAASKKTDVQRLRLKLERRMAQLQTLRANNDPAATVVAESVKALKLELQRRLHKVEQARAGHDNSATSGTAPPAKTANRKLKRQLPSTFLPSSSTVIVLDDDDPAKSPIPGNTLLRDLGFQWLDDYMTVPPAVHELRKESMDKFVNAVRRHKFKVVKKLVKMVNQLNSVAGFVNFDRATNTWWEVTEEIAWREAKNVITFCRQMKLEHQKNTKAAETDKSASPECAHKRKSLDKEDETLLVANKKLKVTSSTEGSPDKSGSGKSRSAYRCGKCGKLKKQNGRRHVCTRGDAPSKYKCNTCGKSTKNGGHNCLHKKTSEESDSEQSEAHGSDVSLSSNSEEEEEVEEHHAPEGFHAYRGGIQVFKQDDHYTAKPIHDNETAEATTATAAAFEPPTNKDDGGEQSSESEEVEEVHDDDNDALIF